MIAASRPHQECSKMARAAFRARCAINSINIRTTDAIARYFFLIID